MRFTKWPALILGSLLLVSEASATAQVVVPVRPPHHISKGEAARPAVDSCGCRDFNGGMDAGMCGHLVPGNAPREGVPVMYLTRG